jgi:hypothetical protein
MRGAVRWLAAAAVGVTVALSIGSPALADPAGPTDYRSEVVAVEPPTPTIEVGIIGGDSFVELTVASGTEVVVLGYQGEENLWFRADGTVWENRNSPSTYLNEDRLGGGEIPATPAPTPNRTGGRSPPTATSPGTTTGPTGCRRPARSASAPATRSWSR